MHKPDKIIVLITYFGKFPWYFSYFLHSCKFNSTIDFLIFSDIKYEYPLPKNVRVIYKTLNDIKTLINKKVGFKVSIDVPYKLCDFKPAYGLIFEDYTKDYPFWGQSDIDLIFGNLRNFMTYEILNNYDFISFRHDYTTGCFTLCRNNELMNNFFKNSKDYKKVFTTKANMAFDELNFKHWHLYQGKALEEIETEIECFTHLIKRADQSSEIKALFDFMLIEGLPGKIKFDNGKLVYSNKYEVALYHMYSFKNVYHPSKIAKKIPNTFYISPTRIYAR